MKSTKLSILGKISAIKEMERGKLCPMQEGRYFNLQSWENGKNRVRYIPASQAKDVSKAIKGYQKFLKLSHLYADLVIADTRKASSHIKKS